MTKKYHFWITGCQMNYADARLISTRLEGLGYEATPITEEADVIILQTCTVRQKAEDKAFGRLQSLKPLKESRPDLTLAMMGCIVGVKGDENLERKYPYVDVWMPPASDGAPLIAHLLQGEDRDIDRVATSTRYAIQDEDVILPSTEKGSLVSAPVAVVYGCSHACTFCIIPHRRGVERTRPVGAVVSEARSLVEQGVKEIILLGQIIDRYGKDIVDGPDLADLLEQVHEVEGLERIRFLTSHPNYMTDKILKAVADLPKVMPQIEIPSQAGDDDILREMGRGYTAEHYKGLVYKIREMVPNSAVHNDIIVGFPGETDQQFRRTYDLLVELEHEKVHVAKYSPRPGTVSARRMVDDVPDIEKRSRLQAIEVLQESVSRRKMTDWLGKTVQVLVEGKTKGRWRGRSPQGKLVFFDDEREMHGDTAEVYITHTGPWSMSGEALDSRGPVDQRGGSIRLAVI
ncbi:MAG: tRNA (N6-isopentenyl adenosine(37)-C2)-methylthiotransferase MiaB [Candidatus Promineifilaceae bacterium]